MNTGLVSKISSDKEKVMKGIVLASEVIGSTLGPQGGAVLMQHIHMVDKDRQPTGKVRSVKDGVTVAKHLAFNDPEMDYGRAMVVEACNSTAKRAGDGTTTTAVLVNAICSNLPQGGNPHVVKKGVLDAVDAICDLLKVNISVPSDSMIDDIAKISANGDAIGLKVSELVKKVGVNGHINVRDSDGVSTYFEHRDGLSMEYGLASPYFQNNNTSLDLDYAHVLILDEDLFSFENQLGKRKDNDGPIGHWVKNMLPKDKLPLVIFCRNIKDSAMKVLLNLKLQQGAPVYVISIPGHDWEKAALMDDISFLTGATVYSKSQGRSLKDFTPSGYGKCSSLYAVMGMCVVSSDRDMSERVNMVEQMIEAENDGSKKDAIKKRLSSLTGGVGTIFVGGYTDAERDREKDTLDDVRRSCFAALEHGVLPGCGNSLAWAGVEVFKNVTAGSNDWYNGFYAVVKASTAPMNKIFSNAFMDVPPVPSKIGVGVDVFTGEETNLLDSGVMDSYLAVTESLRNAASVAVQFLEAQTIIYYDTI